MSFSLSRVGELNKALGSGLKVAFGTISLGTYSAGGVSVTIEGFKKIYWALTQSSGDYMVVASVSGTDNTVTIKVYYFDYAAAAAGAAIEVPDGTDLTGVSVPIVVVGE